MASRHYPSKPLLGACTAIWREDTILLAKRSVAPYANSWAMPGGLVEVGEKLEQAARREVLEETGLVLGGLVFNRFHEIIMKDDAGEIERHFVLAMFVAISKTGEAVAGDDAAEVAWFTIDDLENVTLTGHTMTFVRESLTFRPQLVNSDPTCR
ncbi:MAG: NUDIX hydrolase [Rhizobiaceae bacterium]